MRVEDAVSLLAERLMPVHPQGECVAISHGLREAAILILLYERDRDTRLLLILRPETMTHHASQISLPGGRVEIGDATAWDTALREAQEELGIRPEEVHALGRLHTVHVRASDHSVTPFVGWMDESPQLLPAEDEVAAVIETRLETLLDPKYVETTTWFFRDREWRIVYFRLDGQIVWGATARILADLAERCHASWPGDSPGTVEPLSAQ